MLSIHRRTLYLLIVLCIGQVLLISAQVQSGSGVPVLEALAVGTFSQIQRGTAWVADSGNSVWDHYLALRGAAIENDELRRKVVELQGALQGQQALVERTRALEAALGLQQSAGVETISARVIAGSPLADSLTVTINRGTADGVRANMPVLAAEGVVGRVLPRPGSRTALVQLLADRTAGVAVKLERTGGGAGNAVGGTGDGPLRLEQVPNLADVRAGDRVLTSGLDGIYPPGFTVGTVDRVEPQPAGRRLILVRPAVDFSYLDVVLVVTSSSPTAGR